MYIANACFIKCQSFWRNLKKLYRRKQNFVLQEVNLISSPSRRLCAPQSQRIVQTSPSGCQKGQHFFIYQKPILELTAGSVFLIELGSYPFSANIEMSILYNSKEIASKEKQKSIQSSVRN